MPLAQNLIPQSPLHFAERKPSEAKGSLAAQWGEIGKLKLGLAASQSERIEMTLLQIFIKLVKGKGYNPSQGSARLRRAKALKIIRDKAHAGDIH